MGSPIKSKRRTPATRRVLRARRLTPQELAAAKRGRGGVQLFLALLLVVVVIAVLGAALWAHGWFDGLLAR